MREGGGPDQRASTRLLLCVHPSIEATRLLLFLPTLAPISGQPFFFLCYPHCSLVTYRQLVVFASVVPSPSRDNRQPIDADVRYVLASCARNR